MDQEYSLNAFFRSISYEPKFGELPLCSYENFSEVFINNLGRENFTFTHGLKPGNISFLFYSAIVTYAAYWQLETKTNLYLWEICNYDPSVPAMAYHHNLKDIIKIDRPTIFFKGFFEQTEAWKNDYPEDGALLPFPNRNIIFYAKVNGIDVFSPHKLIALLSDCSDAEAIMKLGKITNTSPLNLFNSSSIRHQAKSHPLSYGYTTYVPSKLQFCEGNNNIYIFTRNRIHEIKNRLGISIAAFVEYNTGNLDFITQATVGGKECCIGKYKQSAYWFNEEKLISSIGSTVIIFRDMRVAFKIQELLDKYNINNDIIITSHLGNDTSVLDWNCLYGKNVIYVCSTYLRSFTQIKIYADMCQDKGAQFRIYDGLVLYKKPLNFTNKSFELTRELEKHLLDNALFVDDWIDPFAELEQIINKSVTIDSFRKNFTELGLFKSENNTNTVQKNDTPISLPALSTQSLLIPPHPTKREEITAFHFFQPQSSAMIIGQKESGKTELAYSFLASFLYKTDYLNLFPTIHDENISLLYIDAESTDSDIEYKIKKYKLEKFLNNNLYIFSNYGKFKPSIVSTIDYNDGTFWEKIINFILINKVYFVFLDNITAMYGDSFNHPSGGKFVEKLNDCLRNIGACPIWLHHVDDNDFHGRTVGSQIISRLARTKIFSCKPNNKRNPIKFGKDIPLDDEGLTIGFHIQTSKIVDPIREWTYWLHQKPNDFLWNIIRIFNKNGKIVDVDSICQNKSTSLAEYSQVNNYKYTQEDQQIQFPSSLSQIIWEGMDKNISYSFSEIRKITGDNDNSQNGSSTRTAINKLKQTGLLKVENTSVEKRNYKYIKLYPASPIDNKF